MFPDRDKKQLDSATRALAESMMVLAKSMDALGERLCEVDETEMHLVSVIGGDPDHAGLIPALHALVERVELLHQRLERIDGRLDGLERYFSVRDPAYPPDRAPSLAVLR